MVADEDENSLKLRQNKMANDIQIKSGVIGGTLLSTVFNISLNDVLFTIVMTISVAVVSFFVSYVLRWLFKNNKMPS